MSSPLGWDYWLKACTLELSKLVSENRFPSTSCVTFGELLGFTKLKFLISKIGREVVLTSQTGYEGMM